MKFETPCLTNEYRGITSVLEHIPTMVVESERMVEMVSVNVMALIRDVI